MIIKKRYIFVVWLMILIILAQNSTYAVNVLRLNNTPPVANFTVEKNRNVKIMVLSDYTGADSANLKNSITSMKSELANDAKINIEYITPTDTQIGTQQGSFKMNWWGMMARGSYRRTGQDTGYDKDNIQTFDHRSNNELVDIKFSHSPEISLPEGESPTVKYNVPVRYTRTEGEFKTSQSGMSTSRCVTYDFYDSAGGKCSGTYAIGVYTEMFYSYGGRRYIEYTIDQDPVLTYDTDWSIEFSTDTPITNTVTGWDLSKINYNITDDTDTYVVFAMNNEDTNYYKTHPNTYRLGQLRSDTNLGKYIKDSEARVYSICSNNLENVNLSTNAQYPITFASSPQNVSVKDLINKSIDGRSLGVKNIGGLTNKIKENVKKPANGNIDMIVATDKDAATTNDFISSVKNNVSSDVDVQSNVVDKSTLEDTSIWTKYVVNGKYKNISTGGRTDVTLILMDNGELWGMGSNWAGGDGSSVNSKGEVVYPRRYGLLGVGSYNENVTKLTRIATGVKDATIVNTSAYYSLIVLKTDGTVWISGFVDEIYRNDRVYTTFFSTLGITYKFGIVNHILRGPYSNSMFNYSTYDGRVYCRYVQTYDTQWYDEEDKSAPCYATYNSSTSPVKYITGDYYILEDGTIYKKSRYNEYFPYVSNKVGKVPSPIKEIGSGLMYCEDNNVYKLSDLSKRLNTNPVKQVYLDCGYFLESDSNVYRYYIRYDYNNLETITNVASNVDKILFVDKDVYDRVYINGMIVKNLNGEIKATGQVRSLNLLPQTEVYRYDPVNYNAVDLTCNNTAADYLQIGESFAFINKIGELYIPVVKDYRGKLENQGKIDYILNSSTSPVKSFSKSKIFNTNLREGSERYFIYISDTIKQDTYSGGSISDYFLFGNLDSTILNYLRANNFNIYVVTPQQALDLKLQYPFVPANIQQYSIRDLLNYSTKDSSICKSANDVVSLISRKYSMFANQGSTTLTLLVDEETMNYNLVYRDFENDPKYADRWKYTHDSTYFDNPNGLASYSGQWQTTPISSFSKVGKYTVVSQFRDNPKDVNSFDPYRLWSNVSAPATILVHRRPIASFNTQIVSKVGTNVNLSYLDYSYDLDHNITRADKGIAARSWQYRKSGSEAWIEGKPTNLVYNTGVYEIKEKVKDIEGAWSKPYIDIIDTANLVPTICANPTAFEGDHAVGITITSDDNGENDFHYMRYAVTKSTAAPSAAQWIPVTNGVKVKPITIATEGTYYLHMEAYDNAGQVGKNMTGPYTLILNKPPVVTITGVTPNYLYVGDDVTAIFKATDPDLDTLNCTIKIKQGTNTIWSGTKTVSLIGSTYPTVSMLTKQNIPAGNYTLEVTATDPLGLTNTDTYDFIVHDINISRLTLSGSWNHWRETWTDKSGHFCPYNPLRFLSLEKVHLNILTTTKPDKIVIDMSPALKAMQFTDTYGNVYDYKNDFFGYYVDFPITINNPGTNYTWDYILPLANSTLSWDNIRKNPAYYITVTAYKGTSTGTKTITGIEITGNVRDLTYGEPVK